MQDRQSGDWLYSQSEVAVLIFKIMSTGNCKHYVLLNVMCKTCLMRAACTQVHKKEPGEEAMMNQLVKKDL